MAFRGDFTGNVCAIVAATASTTNVTHRSVTWGTWR
jgi:hypothetical protein